MAFTEAQALLFVDKSEVIEDSFTEALHNTAAAIVEDAARVKAGQKVLIWYDGPGQRLVKETYLRCLAVGADVRFFRRDFEGDAAELPDLDENGIKGMFDQEEELMNWAENVLIIRNPEDPEAMKGVDSEKQTQYNHRYSEVHKRRNNGSVAWTLFLYPTEYEAKQEGLDYETYFTEVMEACNQPWEEIHRVQAILKEKLDKGERLELIANEDDPDPDRRTHVTMSIKDMTFCNSTIDFNYPGAEVFSAPVVDSVNGQIFAEGKYMYSGLMMEDIRFVIKDGKIVEAHAKSGDENLQQILSRGEGAKYFGEVALGTNGGLTRRFFNPLFNEKVGGSFHMAVGHCYEETVYGDDPVNVNNGNTEDKTSVHWDVTILMHRQPDGKGGGKVVLDGEIIQEDGIFKDSRLAILDPRTRLNYL
jgi:aminopeptidase